MPGARRTRLLLLLAATVLYATVITATAVVATRDQHGDARRESVRLSESELAMLAMFEPGLPRLRDEARRGLDRAHAWLDAHGEAKVIRLWEGDGSLVYRSPRDRAQLPPPDRATAAGGAAWTVEQAGMLRTFRPILAGGALAGVLEMSQPLAELRAAQAEEARFPVLFLATSGVLIWLALLPGSLRLSRLAADAWDAQRPLLLRRVRRGLIDGEMELHYQPKVDLATGALAGVEALVRWRRDGRLVPPAAFLPAVEGSPLIRRLTLFVLDEALRQAREWQDAGTPIHVAVNLAATNLLDARIEDDVAAALARHGVEAADLTLEVTETAVLDDEGAAGAMLAKLAGLGICLSVDDFGTGHSSLARVTRHPFAELKIDRSFVTDLASQDRPVVATIVRLAKTLGLRVVAEGVEDEATLNALRALSCDVAQGYLLARPVPAAELPDAIRHLPALSLTARNVRSLLDDVRESLDLDAAFVAEFVEADEVFRLSTGDFEAFGGEEGAHLPLHDSYCSRMVSGVFPNLIEDAQTDPRTQPLPMTERIGAYIGVPLRRPDGSLYGTLCGLARNARPDLTEEQVATLEDFGDRISPLLESANLTVSARQP